MAREFEVKLYGYSTGDTVVLKFFIKGQYMGSITLCWKTFSQIAPQLCKGLMPGKEKDLVLTQTKMGIKLERVAQRK